MAHGKGRELRAVPHENRIAQFLFAHGADFALQIETREICIAHFAAGRQEPRPLLGRRAGEKLRVRKRLCGCIPDFPDHDGHQVAGPEAEFLVERDVLDALREGVETEMTTAPATEDIHGRSDKVLRHAAIPIFRVDGEGSEKAETSPVAREVRAEESAVLFGGKNRRRIGLPPRARVLRIAHKTQRIGQAEKRAERQADHAVGGRQIALDQRPNDYFGRQ